jgi:putative hydrolase of HD superfamily
MADDRREDILKDLPEEVKLLLQFEVLKELKRQNPLAMAERKERVGEHSWHLALSVLLLAEFASEPIDIARAALLAIVHDTVEAFVGDTFAFGPDVSGQWSREHQAMKGLKESFDSKAIHRLVDLWQEYEDQETSEARFVKGMDAFLPIVLNYMNVEHSSWS